MSSPSNTDDRVVYPDEVDDVKAKAQLGETEATTTNSVEEPPPDSVTPRNMITVPSNCPPGQVMGADGVCRNVF